MGSRAVKQDPTKVKKKKVKTVFILKRGRPEKLVYNMYGVPNLGNDLVPIHGLYVHVDFHLVGRADGRNFEKNSLTVS